MMCMSSFPVIQSDSVVKIEDIEEICREVDFSGTVLIRSKKEEYVRSFGYANRSERIGNSIHTKFGIASGCKIFTAVAICQLVQDGKLSFDAKLHTCIDFELPNFDPDITIHHLLTHSSGVPDYFDEDVLDDFESLWKDKPMYRFLAPSHFIPLFQQEQMMFKPGERFHYNNTGYILLGLVVEKIAGLSFTTYIDQNIFQRCGMQETGYYRMDQLPGATALGYIDEAKSWRTNTYSIPIQGGPDGGAFTTVKDLEKFWNALLTNQLLDQPVTELLLAPHMKQNETLHYGYGVWIVRIDNEIFKHFVMGYDPGVSMQSSVYKNGMQVHILGNTNIDAGKIASRIDEIIWGMD